EFIIALPITVAIALTVSFLVAMFLTPVLCYTFIRQGLKDQPSTLSARVLNAVQSRYTRVIHPLVRHPVITLIVGILSLPAALLLLPLIQQKFFPAAERAQFAIEVDLPLGTRLEA